MIQRSGHGKRAERQMGKIKGIGKRERGREEDEEGKKRDLKGEMSPATQ